MGLSYDLISEFVKITNDKKEGPKEGTVYATVVNSTGGKYVKIDGSDLLTPIDTTTGIEDGERVTVMIKDHKATVTGNITSPSVGKGTVNSLVGAVVDENLVGINADIENLIAKNAYLENVFAQNSVIIDSKIENLVAKDTYLENTYAENATIIDSKIENLEATDSRIENSVIENFQVIDGVVQDLKATNADIKVLNADFAQIKTLVNGNLTSDNILSFNLTSEKVTVDDAFIKDAMIDTISAGKINAGKINTNSVSIGSEDGGMLITGSTQQFMDKNGNVRIQIGKDASGDFTFILYGENGQGQIINQNGITASAIGDGLIVNNMVSDNAAISGGKLDISSVITEINSDNSTTIKSSKIYLNEQAQSLEVAFNSLKTKVDTIQEITIEGDLTAIVEQVQSNTSKIEANKNSISTLISEDTVIKKQVTDLQGTVAKNEETLSAKYTTLTQNLDGFKTTVADTYATKSSVTDVVDNIEANYSTTSVMNSAIEQKAQEISASVSSTYATKNEVSTLDDNLRTNYSTTQQMESAINVAKQEINLGVSSIYETKENTTSKIQNAVDNIQVGGTNLWVLLDLKSGYESNGNITSSGVQHKTRNTIIPTNGAKHLIYQCWNPNKVSNGSNTNRVAFFNSSKAYISSTQVLVLNGQTYQWQIINIPENASYVRLGAICGSADKYDTTIKIKFEFGNKPTDYSLAPEDVINDISTAKTEAISSANNTLTTTISNYYTKSQTDSQINVAKEAINLGVSTTYETKENVETKVTSTLNSAKSYADTKKTEAISTAATDATSKANTAKQEAIASANNTLSTTISNYYTKSQTDSQINVAKEAIDLSVSTNYETKANVESKVSSTLNSAKSYADTKKSEAISTAASDATSKANKAKTDAISTASSDATSKANKAKDDAIKSANNTLNTTIANYYTKEQTDSQIKIAKDAINLGVSNTYETKTNVETKIKDISVGGTNLAYDTNKGTTGWGWGMQTNGGKTITEYVADGIKGVKMTKDANDASGWNYVNYGRFKRDKITPATTYVVSFEMKSNQTFNVGAVDLKQGDSSNTLIKSITTVQNKVTANSTAWTKIIFRLVTLDTLPSSTSQVIYITGIPGKANSTHYIRNLKLEVGNTPTAWSPAPEDITSDITTAKDDAIKSANNTLNTTIENYYTKTQTDSQINIAKEAIDLSVSTNYETKESVETKVTSTLNSAKSYADTKKSEAIDTASSDATSKVNAAKKELNTSINKKANSSDVYKKSEVYTKTQTDSQINIAKEAIDLSVSKTYETKTNVTSKVDSTLKSAKSYADTKKSEAISTAASDATTKANNAKSQAISAAADDATSKVNKINVGSVNRLTGTSGPYVMSINSTSNYRVWDPYSTPDKQTLKQLGFKVGDQITLSFNWKISKNGTNDFVYGDFRTEFVGYTSDGDKEFKGVIQNPVAAFSSSNTSGRSETTVTLTEKNLEAWGLRIRIDNSVLTLTISNVKMEKGNKATSWSPAPEDIESDITAIESETKSIKQTVSSLVLGTDSINASVKSLEESMVNTTNGLASDISKVQEQVNLAMTSSDVKLEIQKELANGVNKVSTSTGFTFDQNGLNISKTDSEMKTQITEDGMKIYKNSEVMLTANNQGVDAKNLHATTYLIIGNNSRMEDFTEDGNKRTAVFWIG